MKKLGHNKITIMKMDIEFSEWAALRQMLDAGTLNKVEQLLVEVHFWMFHHEKGHSDSPFVISYWDGIITGINDHGFRLFNHHLNPGSNIEDWGRHMARQPCCYELSYFKP